MEGGEDSGSSTKGNLNRRRRYTSMDDMYQAADLSLEIVSRICEQEENMIATGRRDSADHKAILELKSGAMRFVDDLFGFTGFGLKKDPLLTEGTMETGGASTGRSGGESLQDLSIGMSEEEILEETIHILSGWIMSRYEAEGRDIAGMLEEEEARKEAEVALKFGFNFELLGNHIDELRRELRETVNSFSPDNKEVLASMMMLASQPHIQGVAKLRWISEEISRLRRMDLDLDSEVKSLMLKLKAESYVSSLQKEERSSGEGVARDETTFAAYRLCWERTWGTGFSFEDQTLVSPMQFTHCKPSRAPVDAVAGSTLQIYSIKVSTDENIKWPLYVYGVVAARDSVDRQRNPIFIRTRNYCQVLTKDDPFLQLTGPIRAIVSMGTVYIETELKAKDGEKSDIALASTVVDSYSGDLSTSLADNKVCTIELCLEELKQSVQATVVSVVVKSKPGSVPFPYGGKILCCSLPCSGNGDFVGIPSRQAVVFDSADGKLIEDRAGHLDLSRRVFSVELKGKLQFHIRPNSQSGSVEIVAKVLLFTPSKWNITKNACCLDDGSVVEITVAWSLIPSKMLL